jgi:hypothetical protein
MTTLDLLYREREINGTMYRATTMALEDWASLTECLGGLLGEPMAAILRGDALTTRDLGRPDLEYVIGGLIGKLTKAKIIEITQHMAKSIRTADHLLTSQQQSLWWPRHMKDLAPVLALFLEAQYSDFFEGLAGSLPQVQPPGEDLQQKGSD